MGIFDIFKRKKKREETTEIVSVNEEIVPTVVEKPQTELSILLEQLPTTYDLDENGLVEITDSCVLAKIDALVPSASTTATSIGNVVKSVQTVQGETLYRVVLQKGGELVDSRGMVGAKRAMALGPNGIRENANLIEVPQGLDKGTVVTNVGAAVMGVASMVVGQYYMAQVDTQLSLISDHLSRVIDFLDVQYKSEVASLMESVYNISKFQISSIENEELRGRELNNIQELRKDCQRLLNQAETAIDTLTSKTYSNYDEYERKVKEIEKWNQYQMILVKLLYQLNILDFTLHLGIKSKEQCFGSFSLHTTKLETLHTRLVGWHKNQCNVLKIDLDESRRKHTGFLAWLEKPISWINDDWNYQKIGGQMVKMISGQTADITTIPYTADNLFNEDVQIIAKGGKYFYLPKHNNF
ncbi:MAG: hypothetical protein KH436_02300 [Firmicutes bacterium]|nr:hypothetical protein [Bacillota bacterium]